MKRFFLGMFVGFLALSALWGHFCVSAPGTVPAPLHVQTVAYGPDRFVVVQHDPNAGFPPVRDGRESVQDIPVPIVPGTRVTNAKIQPPKPPAARREKQWVDRGRTAPLPVPVKPKSDLRVITGRLKSTEESAQEDVRKKVDEAIAEWLAPEVVSSWQIPTSLRDALVQKTEVRPVEKELEGEHATLFEASQTVDFSHARRVALVEAYHRELVARRLAILAGVLAFILACLAALAGYIRADEATKGYYTNRLRLVSAAGVGAAGVLIYQLLV